MITILILSTDRFRNGFGGLSTQIRETVEAFGRLNLPFRFWIVTPDAEGHEGPNYTVIPLVGMKFFTYTPFNEYLAVLNNSGNYVGAAMAHVRNHGPPDLIHAFDWGTFTAAHLLSYHLQRPYIVNIALSIQREMASLTRHFQISPDDNSTLRMLQICSMIEATGLQHSFRVLFNTRIYADQLALPFRFKTHIIPNGIPFDRIRNIAVPPDFRLPGRPEAKKLVFIGRLTVTKNVITILDATLPDNVDFIIIGSDTLGAEPCVLETIRRIASERPHVFYVGGKYDDDKFLHLKAADAIIMPSIHEPFGIVALEALASGTVLLASLVDGMAEFLDSTVCIPCGVTPDSITKAVAHWNAMEDSQVQHMIQKGYQRVQQFSWDTVATQLADQVYTDVLTKK